MKIEWFRTDEPKGFINMNNIGRIVFLKEHIELVTCNNTYYTLSPSDSIRFKEKIANAVD